MESLEVILKRIEENLQATKTEERTIVVSWTEHVYFPARRYYDSYNDDYIDESENRSIRVKIVDQETRLGALNDASELLSAQNSHNIRELLKKVYTSNRRFFVGDIEDKRQIEERIKDEVGYAAVGRNENADYSNLLSSLKRENSRFIQKLKIRSGESLGYSPLRIWTHLHPVATTLTGLATTGVASGLVYALVEYFGK